MNELHRVILGELGSRDGYQPVFRTASVILAKRVAFPDLLTPDDVVVVNSLVERVVSNAPLTWDSQLPGTWITFTE